MQFVKLLGQILPRGRSLPARTASGPASVAPGAHLARFGIEDHGNGEGRVGSVLGNPRYAVAARMEPADAQYAIGSDPAAELAPVAAVFLRFNRATAANWIVRL